MKGKFIVFEGMDGCGKTTQTQLLHEALGSLGVDSVLTEEPSGGPIGNMIRQVLGGRIILAKDPKEFAIQMAHLFAADRQDHLHNPINGVFKLLDSGKTVICSRYIHSSYAYQGDDTRLLKIASALNAFFPLPDLVIYLNNSVECSLDRLQSRSERDMFESRDKLHIVKDNYTRVFDDYVGGVLVVDAEKSVDIQHTFILQHIKTLLNIETKPNYGLRELTNTPTPDLVVWDNITDEIYGD